MEDPVCPLDARSAGQGFRLIETFGAQPGAGFVRLDLHLSRMARSAAALGLRFQRDGAMAALAGIAAGEDPLRCRLTLDLEGRFAATAQRLGPAPGQWRLSVAEERLDSGDLWLRHKTTQRAQYDAARARLPRSTDELLFLNQRGELCEGTITNVFIKLAGGQLATPPLASGLLPGILRQSLIAEGQCVEKTLHLEDLRAADAIFVGNSLRGLIKAELKQE